MTHLNAEHSITSINALPGGNSNLIVTVINASIARVRALPHQPGTWRMVKQLRQQLKSFYKIEATRFKHWLRLKLRTDSKWRQRVLDDLGGDSALHRWDKRAAGTPQASHSRGHSRGHSTERRTQRSAPSRVKTDSTGFYKLAPAVQRNNRSSSSVRTPRTRTASFKTEYPDIKPIDLTPDDFRFAGSHSEEATDDIDPHALWGSLMAPIHALSADIEQLDIVLSQTAGRHVQAVRPAQCRPVNDPAPQGVAARAITAPG